MKGETGYLLPHGCAYRLQAYKRIFGGLLYCDFPSTKFLLSDFLTSTSPWSTSSVECFK